jgi:sec-independent protein translocase protein TatA
MLRGLEGWHIVLIVVVAVLLFGTRKLPDAARSVGQSLRIFKSEMKAASQDGYENGAAPATAANTTIPAPQAVEATRIVTAPVADAAPAPQAHVAE